LKHRNIHPLAQEKKENRKIRGWKTLRKVSVEEIVTREGLQYKQRGKPSYREYSVKTKQKWGKEKENMEYLGKGEKKSPGGPKTSREIGDLFFKRRGGRGWKGTHWVQKKE